MSKSTLFKKGFVVTVIVLFVGGAIAPGIGGSTMESTDVDYKIETKNIKTNPIDCHLADCFAKDEGEILYKTGLASAAVMLFDYDNDGDIDFTKDSILFINQGDVFNPVDLDFYYENPFELTHGGVTHADFNNDEREDFVTGGVSRVIKLFINKDSEQDGIPQLEMHEIMNFSEIVTGDNLSANAYGLTSADFNGDSYVDFAVSYHVNMEINRIAIFYNDGSTNFTHQDVFIQEHQYNEIGSITDLEADDFDGDGDIDLIFTHNTVTECYGGLLVHTQGVASILFNDGENNFVDETIIAIRGCPILLGGPYVLVWKEFLTRIGFDRINPQLTSADYDMDGDIDFLWGDNSGKVEMFENDGTGHFTSPGKFIRGIIHDFGRGSWGLDSADYDYDGDMDFLVFAANMDELKGYIYLKRNQIISSDIYGGSNS